MKNGIEMRQKSKRRFNKKMNKLNNFVKPTKGFDKMLYSMATDIMVKSSVNVPVDTGTLKQSVFLKRKPFNLTVGYNAVYAAFVEFGTVFQRAQPYFRPAILSALRSFKRSWKYKLRKETRI